VQERLIEYWLDNVNERSYQQAFLQMLSGEGHTVVHSTRHMAIEFGKDVISVAPDGVPCAYQLKGNPGGRLTLAQFREIKPQIDELVEQPIVFPGLPNTPHRCYLVTNGEIEEEVHRAIDDLNRGYERRGFAAQTRLELISRGMMLEWATKHSRTFWPEGFSVDDKLIKLYNENGRNLARLDLISDGLVDILLIGADEKLKSRADFERRQISASLFVSFAVKNYVDAGNHIALAAAYSALFTTLQCARERHQFQVSARADITASIARETFFAALAGLAGELGDRIAELEDAEREAGATDAVDYNAVFLTGAPLSDHLLWRARALMSVSMMAILSIEGKRTGDLALDQRAKDAVRILTASRTIPFDIWGEGAVPQILTVIFNWHLTDPTLRANIAEYQILSSILYRLNQDPAAYLATPYHSAEDAIRDRIAGATGIQKGSAERDSLPASSYFAEALFHCFVRSNLKSYAKSLWPELTKIRLVQMTPANNWDFCRWRADGDNETRFLGRRQEWKAIQEKAAAIDTPHIPQCLRTDPVMLLAFLVFLPHRSLGEVIRYLHYAICGVWFMPQSAPRREA